MKDVLDASVAICWVIPRPLTPNAVRLRDAYQLALDVTLVANDRACCVPATRVGSPSATVTTIPINARDK